MVIHSIEVCYILYFHTLTHTFQLSSAICLNQPLSMQFSKNLAQHEIHKVLNYTAVVAMPKN